MALITPAGWTDAPGTVPAREVPWPVSGTVAQPPVATPASAVSWTDVGPSPVYPVLPPGLPIGWTEDPATGPAPEEAWPEGGNVGQLPVYLVRVLKGDPGPPGPVGPAGPIASRGVIKLAAGPLPGSSVVRFSEDGSYVVAASALLHDDARNILGVTATSAVARDDQVEVVFSGELEDDSLNLVPDKAVFVDATGRLTQTFDPSWRFQRVIGIAIAPTKLMVAIRPPVFLSGG